MIACASLLGAALTNGALVAGITVFSTVGEPGPAAALVAVSKKMGLTPIATP